MSFDIRMFISFVFVAEMQEFPLFRWLSEIVFNVYIRVFFN